MLRAPVPVLFSYITHTSAEKRGKENMAEEFKAITTQEEFDNAIKSRLAREESKIRAQYADYDDLKKAQEAFNTEKEKYESDMQAKINDLTSQLTKANETIKKNDIQNMKTKIAYETGLPAGMANRISGETEDEIRKDAATLSEIFKAETRRDLPGFKGEPTMTEEGKKDAALKALRDNLIKKE